MPHGPVAFGVPNCERRHLDFSVLSGIEPWWRYVLSFSYPNLPLVLAVPVIISLTKRILGASPAKTFGSSHVRRHSIFPRCARALLFAICAVSSSAGYAQTAHFGSYETTVVPSGLRTNHNVAVDSSGNVYVPDTWNHRVLKETLTTSGYAQTTIGSGWQEPWGVTIDRNGVLYLTDTGLNQLIKLVPSTSGYTQTTIASGFNSPQGLAVDFTGNLYIADGGNNQIVKETLAGGVYTRSVAAIGLADPGGVAVDSNGDLFIADTNNYRVLLETLSGGVYTQSVFNVPGLDMPFGVSVDQYNNVYVVDTYHNKILMETLTTAGTYIQSAIPSSQLYYPDGVAIDNAGNVYIADDDNSRVIKETLTGVNFGSANIGTATSTLSMNFVIDTAGMLGSIAVLTQGASGLDFANAGAGTCSAAIKYPVAAICTVNATFTPSVSGARNGAVVLQNSAGAAIATAYIYGNGTGPQVNFLPGVQQAVLATGLNGPFGVATDANGNVFIADAHNYRVLKETPGANGYTATTIVGGNQYGPYGLAVDGSGNVYIADYNNSRIVKASPSGSTYVQSTIATNLLHPYGVAVDGSGNVYVADTNNLRIVKETLSGGAYTQSVVPTSSLNDPYGVAVDASGNVYLVDTWHNRALKETLQGNTYTESTIGSGLQGPGAIAVDGNGNVYIADTYNLRIVKETPSGSTYTQSTVLSGTLSLPVGVAVDGNGNVYAADYAGNQVLKQDLSDAPSLSFATTPTGSESSHQMITLENVGNASLTFPVPNTGSNPTVASNFILTTGGASDCPQLIAGNLTAGSLAAGAECQLPILFAPQVAGSVSGSVVLTDSALNASAPAYTTQTIRLTGAGAKSSPTISWAAPPAITYGMTLGATQLNATSSVAGSFAYVPAPGTLLKAGSQALSVTFTPTDTTDYNTATAAVTLAVNPATPALSWAPPSAITYGTALGAAQLNATSSVPGIFAYSPVAGTILSAGSQTLSVTFTPSDTINYSTTTTAVILMVNKAAPSLSWAVPAAIPYGKSLTGTQLNATSSVAGTLAYSPAAGAVLTAGAQTLSVIFTPNDTTDYSTVTATVNLLVNKATPSIAWASPVAITYGSTLTATQLNATSSVAGTFVYSPAGGTVLTAYAQALTVTFTPTDASNFDIASAGVTLLVNKATPPIIWAVPATITYGTALSPSQLNATSTIAGAFSYNPAAGAVLSAGSQTLSVIFTPTDATDYTTAITDVSQTVAQAAQTIDFAPPPSPVSYGVGSITLSATGGASALPVKFNVAGPGTLNGSTLTVTGAGTVVVTASQAGNSNYAAAKPVSQTIVVNQSASTTSLSAVTTTPTQTQVDILTATVTGAGTMTGTVTFSAGGVTLCTATVGTGGVATCVFTPTVVGDIIISAQYQGDFNHLASASTLVLSVKPLYDIAISVKVGSTMLVYPGATNVTTCITPATNRAATGTVGILDGATVLTTLTLGGDGCANWYISPGFNAGAHAISVTYSGDAHNGAGSSSPVVVTVNPVPVTLAVATGSASIPYGVSYHATVTASSNAGPALGAITYSLDGGAPVSATLSGGNAKFALSGLTVGSHQVVVSYALQSNFAAALSENVSFAMTDASVVVALIPSANSAIVGTDISFVAEVTSSSAGAPNAIGSVAFYDGTTLLSTVAVDAQGEAPFQTSRLMAGTHNIVAAYSASSDFSAGSANASVIVAPIKSSTKLTATSNTLTLGQSAHLTATVVGLNPTGTVAFISASETLCTGAVANEVATCSFTPASVGGLSVTAKYSGDTNNLPSGANINLSVAGAVDTAISLQFASTTLVYPGATNITVCITSGKQKAATGTVKIVDGASLLNTETLGGDGCAYWYITPGLAAGAHSISATYSGDKNNPAGTSAATMLTVGPVPVSVAVIVANALIPYGVSAHLTVTASSDAGPPLGSITYTLDGGAATSVALSGGNATFSIADPTIGSHQVVVAYAQQTNYSAAAPKVEIFTVFPSRSQ